MSCPINRLIMANNFIHLQNVSDQYEYEHCVHPTGYYVYGMCTN